MLDDMASQLTEQAVCKQVKACVRNLRQAKKFSDRVKLEASQDEDLPTAIDTWSLR